jgi:hypothetical protein
MIFSRSRGCVQCGFHLSKEFRPHTRSQVVDACRPFSFRIELGSLEISQRSDTVYTNEGNIAR